MKIKNIQQYRSIYKNEVRKMPDRNENFIGNFYSDNSSNKVKGWFDIYFGDTDGSSTAQNGVKNKLKSFLDMAKDGQAVYEFLQNAVDAGGTKFLMFYKQDETSGNDYLLVMNNGEMFSPASIRSILNIGSSTKANSADKIGQFGIGFKLAHRLVGKDDALDELVNNLNGPILYSWKNNEIKEFSEDIEFEDLEYRVDKDENIIVENESPWLFKILLTTFPCSYIERPVIWDGNNAELAPFSKEDLQILATWLKEEEIVKHIENDFQEGSLFLMKLGQGKLKELKEEPNLKLGVKFSLAVLKETSTSGKALQTAIINGEEVERPELQFHKFEISKSDEDIEDYSYIRFGKSFNDLSLDEKNIIESENDIEILFGYRKHNEIGDYFKGSPSFYLYFPVSQEVHNFNFILHSNALYKGASRVFLQSGGGVGLNERLFTKILEKLRVEFTNLISDNPERFLDLFTAFLTSGETVNNESTWVTNSFTKPLNQLIKEFVPVKNATGKLEIRDLTKSNTSSKVFILDSAIRMNLDHDYFYFENTSENNNIINKTTEKLTLEKFNIYDILNLKDAYIEINNWIQNNPEKIEVFYNELITKHNSLNSFTPIQKENLSKIKWILLSDDSVKSIIEIGDSPIFLLNKRMFTTKDIFKKLGLVVSEMNLEEFVEKFNNNFRQAELKQFAHLSFTKLFSDNVHLEQLELLNNEERFQLFEAFRENGDNSGERIRLLKLYKNNIGKYQPFGKMLNLTGGLAGLLSIDESQLKNISNTNVLKSYLKNDAVYFYEKIYLPQWKDVLEYLALNEININSIIGDLDYAYKHSNWDDKENFPLSKSQSIIYEGKVIKTPFYFISTKVLENFEFYQNNLLKFYNTYIPDQKYSSLFQQRMPYGYHTEFKDPELLLERLTFEEVTTLLEISKDLEIDFFEANTIIENNNLYDTISGYNCKQYHTLDSEIIRFISNHINDKYKLLPNSLFSFSNLVNNKENALKNDLANFILNHRDFNSFSTDAMFLFISTDDDTKTQFIQKLDAIYLDDSSAKTETENIIQFISSLQRAIDINLLRDKICISSNAKHVCLGDILPQISSIIINHNSISAESLFPKDVNPHFELVNEFFNKYIDGKVDNISFFRKLFRIENEPKLEELKEVFLQSLNDGNEIGSIYQLYFVLFSNVFSSNEIKNLFILKSNDDYEVMSSRFYIFNEVNKKAIKSDFCINEVFNKDLLLLKQICDRVEEGAFSLKEYFILSKSSDYSILNTDLSINEKLNFLYHSFSNTPIDNLHLDLNEIDSYLNIFPEQKLLNELSNKDNIQIKNEVLNWLGSDDSKESFLKQIGFRFDDDIVSKLLKSIKANQTEYDSFSSYNFNNEEVDLVINYIFENQLIFNLENLPQINFLVQFIKRYDRADDDAFVLVYHNKYTLKISYLSETLGFCYDIIDQVFENTSDTTLNLLFNNYDILYKNICEDYKCENSVEFKLEIIEESANELNAYFYNEWKKEVKNISIYSADALEYSLFVLIENEMVELCKVKYKNDLWLHQQGNSLKLYFTTDKSLKYVVEYFSSSNFEKYDSYNLKLSLKKLEDHYNSVNATISEALKSLDHEEVKEILQTQIEKEERRLERENIISGIKEEEKYSKEWFSKYLKYLNTVNEKNSNSENKTLRFKEIINTGKPKFYKFSACNSIVPDNIDESRNVSLKLYYGKNVKTFTINSISQKNQVVLIQLEENLAVEIFDNFFMAEINYQPTIDLLHRLENAFIKLDTWDKISVDFPSIHYIYGPPGTGKTTTLKNTINDLYSKNTDIKILVLAPTNKACDVLAEKLYENEFTEFIRLSSPTSEILPDDFYKNSLNIQDIESKNVLISTIHRHSYFKVLTDHSEFYLYNFDKWDYVIVDEASMINLPYIVFSAMITKQSNSNSKIIIAGDPKQIPPVPELSDNEREEIEIETENIYSMLGLNSFDEEIQKEEIRYADTVQNLKIQYRSVPEIGNLVSNFSYNNIVQNHRTSRSKRELPEEIKKLLPNVITFLNVPLEKDNQLFSINKLIYSSYHLYSCILVNEFISFFDKFNNDEKKWTIGIISPYKAQAVLANRLKAGLKLKSNIHIIADTVHGFQGDECDIVFYICNPSSYSTSPHPRSLLSNDFIYNVAISRAKDYLIIVNPFEKLIGNPNINKIKKIQSELTNTNIKIINSSLFEKLIFNYNNYIDDNTFITNHDDVNVYTKDVYKYFIKKNSVSIDLQVSSSL